MPQELVSQEEFIERVTAAFAADDSSIWFTHKRSVDGEGDDGMDDGEYDVLIRCTHGTTKFSTRIPAASLAAFHATYGTLLRTSMAPHMRKRDKKREKARAEAEAKRRKELYVDVVVDNTCKRGKGKRQRDRKIRAQRKKEAEREKLETREAQRGERAPAPPA